MAEADVAVGVALLRLERVFGLNDRLISEMSNTMPALLELLLLLPALLVLLLLLLALLLLLLTSEPGGPIGLVECSAILFIDRATSDVISLIRVSVDRQRVKSFQRSIQVISRSICSTASALALDTAATLPEVAVKEEGGGSTGDVTV